MPGRPDIYTGGPVNIQAVSFPGYTGERIFQVRHGESLKKFIIVDGGSRTHDPETHVLPTTPFVEILVGHYRSQFDHLHKVNQ